MIAKILAGLLGVAALGAGLWAGKGYIERNALTELDLAMAEEQLLEERAAREHSDRARTEYHDELKTLQTARDRAPARPVRVCRNLPDPTGAGPRAPGGSGGTVGEVAAGGNEPPTAGPDIGPELYAAADAADLDLAACRALYGLVKARGLLKPSSP